jgi:predicted metal-dependent hydrolase
VPLVIKKCELKLKVKVARYFLQRMKTKWGSCNHRAGHIRLNTQLVTKPKVLEYVIVHEMVHLIEPTHNDRFLTMFSETEKQCPRRNHGRQSRWKAILHLCRPG